MRSNRSGVSQKMRPWSCFLFSLLFLLLPWPSLFYSFKKCTVDFFDQTYFVCDEKELNIIPSEVPKTATYLDLRSNLITSIGRGDLSGFTRLKYLNIQNNCIFHIEDGAFSDMSVLTELRLGINNLTKLTDNMFKGLSQLLNLELKTNKIKSISKFSFSHLSNLRELNLNRNKLFDLSDIVNIVTHCPLLINLGLGQNQLNSLKSDELPFSSLSLEKLDLSCNPLRKFSIHSNIFSKLEHLELSETGPDLDWEVSDKGLFRNLTSLDLTITDFDLDIYRLIFESVDSVETLYLRGISSVLIECDLLDFACRVPSLRRLDLSICGIYDIRDDLFDSCTNITDLNLSGNIINDLPKSMQDLTQLTKLYLEGNRLSYVPDAIGNMSTLRILSFKGNLIKNLICSDFYNLKLLIELNLNDNNIGRIGRCVFRGLKSLKELHLENNSIFRIQFPGLPTLMVLNAMGNNLGGLGKRSFSALPSLADLSLKLNNEIVEEGAFEGLISLKNLTLFMPFLLDRFNGLEQLERLEINIFITERRPVLTNFTLNLPSLQELFIRADAHVRFFPQTFLQTLGKLRVLSSNRVFCYSNDMFINTPHLMFLQILNCAKFNPLPELFQPITDLKMLDLSKNSLRSLDFLGGANLTGLEQLILVNNQLTVINETVFEALPSLKYLDLSGNPFMCDCSNIGFIEWAIRHKQVQVDSAYEYTCSSPPSEEGHFLLDFNVQSCWEFTGFLCFMSSSALVLVTLLSSFIYHFLRWQLVYGLYLLQAFLYDSKKRRQGCPHIYDAFVSYNVHDEDWVYRELLPELEEVQGWRLCLHHRDFQPGKPIIENITDAIYSSRKTLCVISRRYLQSEWCSREIQMASFRLFDEQKDVLILLFLEEIPSNHLSPFYRMRKLVKRRTYLSWTQAQSHKGLFWENVRRALECGNEPGDNHNPITANI